MSNFRPVLRRTSFGYVYGPLRIIVSDINAVLLSHTGICWDRKHSRHHYGFRRGAKSDIVRLSVVEEDNVYSKSIHVRI